jgi:hypothetical protein
MPEPVRDSQVDIITDMVLEFGGHVTHGTMTDQRMFVAEFSQACFSFKPPALPGEPIVLNWYSQSLPFNEEIFDKVNDDHRRRATLVAGDYETLEKSLRPVLEAVKTGFAFAL